MAKAENGISNHRGNNIENQWRNALMKKLAGWRQRKAAAAAKWRKQAAHETAGNESKRRQNGENIGEESVSYGESNWRNNQWLSKLKTENNEISNKYQK